MKDDYNEFVVEENSQINYSGIREKSSLSIGYHTDCYGRPEGKIYGRRGRDDRPKNEESVNKVRNLSNRRNARRLKYSSRAY